MKKVISVLLLIALLSTMLFSCTSKTPDVVASEEAAAINLETMTWTLEVEGADVTEYTRADGEKHELSKVYGSVMKANDQAGTNGTGSVQISFICEGITIREFLEDVGRPDATKVTYYGDVITFKGAEKYHTPMSCTIEGDLLKSDDVLIGWVCNKKDVLFDSDTYVGVFASATVLDVVSNCSVSKIVIE
ncbi:MAG: hypothetical protein MJ141_01210 [Clostridia bacterium]|nr:hypothetical protein [Clostridia bacterium]